MEITLKNGAVESDALVTTTMMALWNLMQDRPIALYELTARCRNSGHQFFGNAKEVLQDLALVDRGGSVHGSIKNIVLSAVKGEGLELVLESPIQN